MDKVYLVTTEDVYVECTSTIKVFKNPDDAKKYFDSIVAEFKKGPEFNSDTAVVEGDEDKGIFTWYEDGCYNENRYEVLLFEKEVH